MKRLDIGNLSCDIVRTPGDRICYILFGPLDETWLQQAAADYGCTIVTISGMDWDNDLTPWPAPGAPTGCPDFKGLAPQFNRYLSDTVIPTVEKHLGLADPQRTLVGVSLSGLFSLWQWVGSDMFHNIVSISGSFWYKGFVSWLMEQPIPKKQGCAYLSLGKKEPYSPVSQFRSVGRDTAEVVKILESHGIPTIFEWTSGTHYAPIYPRLTYAFNALFLPHDR